MIGIATGDQWAQAAVSLSRSEWRWELAKLATAAALLSVAFGAIAFFVFRRKTRNPTLVYFGVFCVLYAIRLLIGLTTFQSLFAVGQTIWIYINWIITCTIILPFGLFLYQLANEQLRKLLRWLLTAQTAFAVFGIVAAALGVHLRKLYFANSVLMFATFAAIALFLAAGKWRPDLRQRLSTEFRVFIAGFAIWLVFVVHANLQGLRILAGRNVEFVGFLVFVACLGYISAYRTFANEERLLAISKELEIARRIQSSILPQSVPRLEGLEIAARYSPMSAVAGDFYDFLSIDGSHVGILVADVTGHGVPAALIASMLKIAAAGQAAEAHDPARFLTALNCALCGKFDEHFITAAYLFVDIEKQLLRYAGAGHPPLLLASGGEAKVREIDQNGLMLGMFPEAEYAAVEINFSPGDRCLLYTDGAFEARNSGQEEFGRERLAGFLEIHRDSSADPVSDALLEAIARWSGNARNSAQPAQDDDITLLVVDFKKRTALAER